MKYTFIEKERSTHRVERLCTALNVSRSGYYTWRSRPKSRRTLENKALLLEIRRVHTEHREACGALKT